jgi:hypothetical protein
MTETTNDNKDRPEPVIHCRKIGGSTIGIGWFHSYFPEADEAAEEDEQKDE